MGNIYKIIKMLKLSQRLLLRYACYRIIGMSFCWSLASSRNAFKSLYSVTKAQSYLMGCSVIGASERYVYFLLGVYISITVHMSCYPHLPWSSPCMCVAAKIISIFRGCLTIAKVSFFVFVQGYPVNNNCPGREFWTMSSYSTP